MTRRDSSELEDDLRATSDSLRHDASRLAAIEDDKRDLEIGDPELSAKAREAERLADGIQRKSRIERDLSEGKEPEVGRAN